MEHEHKACKLKTLRRYEPRVCNLRFLMPNTGKVVRKVNREFVNSGQTATDSARKRNSLKSWKSNLWFVTSDCWCGIVATSWKTNTGFVISDCVRETVEKSRIRPYDL